MELSGTGTAAQRSCTDGPRSKRSAEPFRSCSSPPSKYPSSRSSERLSVQAAGRASFCRPRRTAVRLSWPAGGPCSVTRAARRLRSLSSTTTSPRASAPKRSPAGAKESFATSSTRFRPLPGACCPTAPSISSMTVGSSSRAYRRRMHWAGSGKPPFIPMTGRRPSPRGAAHCRTGKRPKVKCECGRRTGNFAGGSSAMSQCTTRRETSRNGMEALLISTTASAQNPC